MARLRFTAYVVFGLIPATALGALAALVLISSLLTGVIGAVLGPMTPIAGFGLIGSIAFWASMFSEPNDGIRMGLLCGIGTALLILGYVFFVFREHVLTDSGLLGLTACSLSSAITAALYLVNGGRPRWRSRA